jgi:hypothetical protein
VGQTGIENELRNFWLIFAALGLVAMSGLIFYNKFFSADTPETNSRARTIMIGVYSGLILIGGYFLYSSVSGSSISYKTLVQSIIMLLIGAGGILVSRKK